MDENPPVTDESPPPKKLSRHLDHWQRFKDWYLGRKKWTIPGSAIIVILLLAAVPWTRYNLASLVHHRSLDVQVMDATAGTPVSGATVKLGAASAETNGTGVATLHNVKLGNQKVTVSKKYYQSKTYTVLSPVFKQKATPKLKLAATGRQVLVKVTNLINGKVLGEVQISAAGTTAKTATDGSATMVLPAQSSSEKATLKLDGFNDSNVTLKVSNQKIQENDFKLTPAGKVYFLSKLSGNIDVVKTNLDGSGRQTVLAGTGNEDDQNTVLLASKDWKFLALLARRAGNLAALYLIDTSNDSSTNIDSGNATFSLVGWSGHNFVYTLSRNGYSPTQANGEALKSYNADNNQLSTLDQTAAAGNDADNWAHETYPDGQVYLEGNQVVYVKQWDYYQGLYVNVPTLLDGKQDGIYSIGADGKNAQTLHGFDISLSKYTTFQSYAPKPNQIYFEANDPSGISYYAYANGKVTDQGDLSKQFGEYYENQDTYLQSPSGGQTFWSEPRDGKNTLFIGDQSASGSKQIATLSDYSPYGWYTDNYLLVQKDGSELYVMPVAGIKNDSQAVKITDYHKPAQTFYGYGGGYGGL